MPTLPVDLQKLPPQALDVIRYLGRVEAGAWVDDILKGTGLTERGFGKAIRRLVTRYYADMPEQGFYRLTTKGQQAAQDIRDFDGEDAPVAPGPAAAALLTHPRQLAVVCPKELVAQSETVIQVGCSGPPEAAPSLNQPGRLILRLSAPGCDVDPVERPLEVATSEAAGPALFRLHPRQTGTVRVKVEAFQLVAQDEIVPVGGLFFDLSIAGFPTPTSGEQQALGAQIRLQPGADDAD